MFVQITTSGWELLKLKMAAARNGKSGLLEKVRFMSTVSPTFRCETSMFPLRSDFGLPVLPVPAPPLAAIANGLVMTRPCARACQLCLFPVVVTKFLNIVFILVLR